MRDQFSVFSGSAHPDLAREICALRGMKLSPSVTKHFTNDNLYVQLEQTVREKDVFIVQPFYPPPVSDRVLELLMMLDAARLASAKRVTAVIPYYSYSRSDKKDEPRISIAGRLIADLLQTAGAQRVLTMTLHSPQVHGFFGVPTDHLSSMPVFVNYFRHQDLSDTTVVTPDIGHAKRGAELARQLKLPIAAVSKKRVDDATVVVDGVIGDIRGHRVILVDDEIDTGGSIVQAVNLVKENGARRIYVAFVHPVFSANAAERLAALPVTEFITTDSIPISGEKRARFGNRLTILSVAPLLGEVIRRAHEGRSVGEMFNE